MGKNRARRFGHLRPNPTGLISEKDLELESELDIDPQHSSTAVPSTIVNIIEKLQAPDAEERSCGCQILAGIVSEPKAIGFLLQMNAVKIVAPLFMDACADVRKSALGALRNMSVHGQADVCDVMVTNDILTPLTTVIKQFDLWVPEKECTKYDTSTEVLIEAVELLSNLCENSSTAVRWFNKQGLVSVLLPLLKVQTYGYVLSIAVARCLHVVSENNADVSQVCQQPEVLSGLLNVVSTGPVGVDGVLFRTLVTGILLNLSEIDLTHYYKGIVASLAEVLDADSLSVLAAAAESSQEAPEEIDFENELSWPEVDKLLNAQGTSLELLANLCCPDDDWEDVEGHGSSESSDDQAMETTGATADVDKGTLDSLCLASEVSTAFAERDVMSKILSKAYPLDTAQISKLEASKRGRTTLLKLRDLQSRALLCLSNMVAVIDDTYLAQSTPLNSIWTGLYQLASISQDIPNEDLKWALTSAMRAVMQRLADIQRLADMPASKLSNVSSSDLDFLVNLAKGSKNRETQINVVRIISTVGCILSISQEPHPLLKNIGLVLVEVACSTEDLVVAAEALDSLFDVFKEDHIDPIVREILLVEKLATLQPSFKDKISRQRKNLGENYAVVMMAKSNLAGYIKYKQSQK